MSGPDNTSTSRALTGRRRAVLGLLALLAPLPVIACGRRGDLELPAGEAADRAEEERRARDAYGG